MIKLRIFYMSSFYYLDEFMKPSPEVNSIQNLNQESN